MISDRMNDILTYTLVFAMALVVVIGGTALLRA
jgi:hypothetical protein